jgi:CBS domain containing-hemolysin-like protein
MLEITVLIGISAICSGLNVGFMALDMATLRRKAKLGDKHAKAVLPLRRNSHLALSAILLTNVGAVSATSLVLEHHFYGLIAGLITTLLVVIFGEIVPQAIFVRRALVFVGRFVPLLKFMIIATYPFSRPLQLLLDKMLTYERAPLHSRHELGMMIAEHTDAKDSELDDDEIEIIKGALQLSEKRVGSIMTPIDGVYWLTPDVLIDAQRIDEIKATGHSRIPIFNNTKTICFGILLVKQLVDIDFDDNPPHVDDLHLYPAQTVGSGTALDTMFRKFLSTHTQLIPIERDDAIVGVVTIEDIIEEIVGREIEDETDSLKALRAR